ncbi:unnamed protein product [Prorocentrum cordatum]|uniref:Uncharacterized protein n=1 Tax=Prorocentrum cordatum TaxID=2364126 RepID=A0ABN9XCP2_9DINO|nr:unnamed protein product [Polarella glacialis]
MLAAASVGRRRRELRHGRPLASRRLWERQRAVGKRRQRRAGGGRESPALPPRGVSAPPPPCPRAESRGERWGSKEEEGRGGGEEGRGGHVPASVGASPGGEQSPCPGTEAAEPTTTDRRAR